MADVAPPSPPHLDPNAWDALIGSLNPATILVVISSWMGERIQQHLTVEDIWQETLAMAWRDRHQHEWRGVRAYRAWLMKIAKNRVHDAADRMTAQKRGGQRATCAISALGSSSGSFSALLPPDSATPSRIAIHHEEATLMSRALDALPTELLEVVQLRIFEELPMKVVAERAGIGLTSAKERFFKGASLYRSRLEELLADSTRRRESAR